MGNSETRPDHNHDHKRGDPLRDYSPEVRIPPSISKPTSNLLLAYTDGNYYPCIILHKAKSIENGYLVFFFHSQTETEIPSSNVIGNFKALLDCKVSFTVDGIEYCGKVFDMCTNEKNEATNFFISCGDQCVWISLPFLFLTVGQARQLCC